MMKSFAMKIYKKSNLQNFSITFFYCKIVFYGKIVKLSFSVSICILKLEKIHIIENIIKHSFLSDLLKLAHYTIAMPSLITLKICNGPLHIPIKIRSP